MLTPGTLPSRLAALLLLLLLLLVAYQFAAAPLLALYQGNQETIQRHADLLQRYEALAASEPSLAAELEERKAAGEASTGYLDGPSDALAAAQLQDRIKETIEAVGGEVRSAQILPATALEEGPPVRRAGLKLRFVTTIDGLAEALYELETTEPFLFVDQLAILRDGVVGVRNASGEEEPRLDIRMDVFGYLRDPGSDARN